MLRGVYWGPQRPGGSPQPPSAGPAWKNIVSIQSVLICAVMPLFLVFI